MQAFDVALIVARLSRMGTPYLFLQSPYCLLTWSLFRSVHSHRKYQKREWTSFVEVFIHTFQKET